MSTPHFGHELFDFLSELDENNTRAWFEANKPRYERHVKGAALDFIRAFEAPLHAVSPHFQAIPKAVGGSLFRIHRDVRFSKDKSPYKTHTGVHFRHEAAKDAHAPGFYLHLAPGEAWGGFGIWMPPNPALNQIRDAIVKRPDEWAGIQQTLAVANMPCDMGEALKRVPAGYAKDHPHADDLRRKSHAATYAFTPDQVVQPDFIDRYAAACQQAAPLMRFICEALGVAF
jgi:uncharacterized protein (TIGR02453 family)